MTHDIEEQPRKLSENAKDPPAQEDASVEAPREQIPAGERKQRNGGDSPRLTRRGVIGGIAGAVGGLVLGNIGGERAAQGAIPSFPVSDDPTKVPGRPSSPYGFRSQFETAVRWPAPYATTVTVSMTPLHDARGIITPSSLHHEVHHGGVPTIDPAKHTLLIHGLVKRPLKLTVYDLIRFPSVNRIHFLECAGILGENGASPR